MKSQRDFSALVAMYADDLYRYARWLCRDPHLAEDLVQEALLRGWDNFAALREVSSTKAWLITTLRREYFRQIGSAQGQVHGVSLDDVDTPLDESELPIQTSLIEDQIDAERCLNRLSSVYREVLVLQLYFGYATNEIAALLGTTETAVANRLLRARKALVQAAHVSKVTVLPLRRKSI